MSQQPTPNDSGNTPSGLPQQPTANLTRSRSLLERIREQREREAAAARGPPAIAFQQGNVQASRQSMSSMTSIEVNPSSSVGDLEQIMGAPEQIQVPNYSPDANNEEPQNTTVATGGTGGIFNLGLSSLGFGGNGNNDPSQTQGLLSDAQQFESEFDENRPPLPVGGEYSMSGYFHMFVMDVYGLFRSMPVIAQVIVVIFLLWIVWKLI